MLEFFNGFRTIDKFKSLGLPLLSQEEHPEHGLHVFEIDLSKRKQIKKRLHIPKFDCFPVLFVHSKSKNKTL
jgi:hypothetical protein